MTDKQIIIDDCIHLDEWKHCDICEKLIKTKDGANGKKREHLLTEEDLRCDFYPNCYYKQLKRKEQECDELKIYIESNEQQVKEVETLVMDNDRLINELDQLKQTLAEIKKLAEKEFCRHIECCEFCANSNDCLNLKIIEKINEVENGNI